MELDNLTLDELRELQAKIATKTTEMLGSAPKVAYDLDLYAGNPRAGCSKSVEQITAVANDLSTYYGESVSTQGTLPEGSLVEISATGGSHCNTNTTTVIVRIKRGAEFEITRGYQQFTGSGAELAFDEPAEIDTEETQALIDQYPQLTKLAGNRQTLQRVIWVLNQGLPVAPKKEPCEILTGTPRQIAWAKTIRAEFLPSTPTRTRRN